MDERELRGVLAHEHFLGEVIEHEAMAAGEGGQEARDIGSAAQRECGKLEPDNPAFRAALEGSNRFG